jgi:hypothetical protein
VANLFVPVVLAAGGANGSYYTSEMTLTNRGTNPITLNYSYTAASGGGSGSASDSVPPGQQRIVPDALKYLKGLGVPIADSGSRVGTLAATVNGVAISSEAGLTVRTTTALPQGRAGLAYAGISTTRALTGASYLFGLRQNATDRSNVALQNAGSASDGNISLHLTVYSGDSTNPFTKVLPDIPLGPGQWGQIDRILITNGMSLSNGYIKIERVQGRAPYYAYAVINDNVTSDGSFISPVSENAMNGRQQLTLPVVVETGAFSSELIVTNWGGSDRQLTMWFKADAISYPTHMVPFNLDIKAGEQMIIPNIVQYMRDHLIDGIGPRGSTFVGPLIFFAKSGDLTGIGVAARTSSPGGGGQFGLFYGAVPDGMAPTSSAWILGLQQNQENRTNLALVNTGEVDQSTDAFTLEIFDGETGALVQTISNIQLSYWGWTQFDRILTNYAPGVVNGYARITRTAGNNPFIAYAVINDGGQPQQRTGDGAFLTAAP